MSVVRMLIARGRSAHATNYRVGMDAPALTGGVSAARRIAVAINADVLDQPHAPNDPDRALSALWSIPADLERPEWLPVVFAARSAGVRVADFLTWCRTGGNKYTGDDDALKVWNSFDLDRPDGIGPGTLYKTAQAYGWQDPRRVAGLALQASTLTAAADDEQTIAAAQPHDAVIAQLWVKYIGANFRFNHSAKRWHSYRAGSWETCSKGEQVESMKQLAGLLLAQCANLATAGRDTRKMVAAAQRAQSAQGIDAALKLAQSDPAIAVTSDEWDRDPNLFNAANCVIDLRTGAAIAHAAAQMLYRQSPVQYLPEAACPLFMQFMKQISCGDPEWVEFMQRAFGYSLSGHVSEEKLFFWLGKGANGKSVLANLVRHIMGTYAVTVPPAFLMQSRRDGGSATPELAMLAGARMALGNETEAGARLSGATVKTAVSTEYVTARALYGAPFTFAPTHKLLIRGNHRPIISDDDEGIWRRILLIPFDLDLPAQDRDPDLEARLLVEAPGILTWMVRGFIEWKADGLKVAKRVTDASLAYRKDSDLLAQWLSDRCETGSAYNTQQRIAYGNYRRWCDDQGLRAFSKASFTRGLIERGIGEGREGGGARHHTYTGLRLVGNM